MNMVLRFIFGPRFIKVTSVLVHYNTKDCDCKDANPSDALLDAVPADFLSISYFHASWHATPIYKMHDSREWFGDHQSSYITY